MSKLNVSKVSVSTTNSTVENNNNNNNNNNKGDGFMSKEINNGMADAFQKAKEVKEAEIKAAEEAKKAAKDVAKKAAKEARAAKKKAEKELPKKVPAFVSKLTIGDGKKTKLKQKKGEAKGEVKNSFIDRIKEGKHKVKITPLAKLACEKLGIDFYDIPARNMVAKDGQFETKMTKETYKKDTINVLSYYIDYIEKFDRYICKSQIISVADSRVIDLNDYKDNVLVKNGDRLVIKNKFSLQVISIKLSEEANKRIAETTFGSDIIVDFNHDNGNHNIWLETATGYFSFVFNKDQKSLSQKSTQYKFRLDPVTASGTRAFSGLYSNVTLGDNRFELFDTATCGALTKFYEFAQKESEKVVNEETKKDFDTMIKKKIGYIGNAEAACVSGGMTKGYHILHREWRNDTDESFLSKEAMSLLEAIHDMECAGAPRHEIDKLYSIHEEIVNLDKKLKSQKTQDGQLYVDVVELTCGIYEATGMFVMPEVLMGRMLQVRPASIKASAIPVHPYVYKVLLKGTKSLYGTADENATEEDKKGKLVAYGDADRSMFIADTNCVKLDFNFGEMIDFTILAFNKTSKGAASKQMYKNIIFAAQKKGCLNKILALIERLEHKSIDTILNKALTHMKKPSLVSPNEILKAQTDGFFDNVRDKSVPTAIVEHRAVVESRGKQALNAAAKSLDRMHGLLNVESRRLASDPVFILTGGKINGLLKLGESFINDPKIKRSVTIKYPVAGLEEQYPSINVSIHEIRRRTSELVNTNKITKEEKMAIDMFYSHLKRTVKVLPALMFLANACAGLDFDYDGEVAIIEVEEPENEFEEITNEIIALLFSNGMRGVNIIN